MGGGGGRGAAGGANRLYTPLRQSAIDVFGASGAAVRRSACGEKNPGAAARRCGCRSCSSPSSSLSCGSFALLLTRSDAIYRSKASGASEPVHLSRVGGLNGTVADIFGGFLTNVEPREQQNLLKLMVEDLVFATWRRVEQLLRSIYVRSRSSELGMTSRPSYQGSSLSENRMETTTKLLDKYAKTC